jgi:competence protein ComEC
MFFAITLLFAGAHASDVMRVHFIDVGQGDATLVELPCGAMLVDTGGEGGDFESVKALTTYLDGFFARRTDLNRTLDVLLLTHPHIDHIRGAPAVLAGTTVRRLIDNGVDPHDEKDPATPVMAEIRAWMTAHPETTYRPVTGADFTGSTAITDAAIDPFTSCSGATDPEVSVLWGGFARAPLYWDEKDFHNQNNHSVVTRVRFGKVSLLLTGDLETEGIQSLLRDRSGSELDIDIYQVGHHGSYNGTSQPLMDAMSPRYAVISMGPEERHRSWTAWAYGHPRQSTVTMLERGVSERRNTPVSVPIASGAKTFRNESIYTRTYGTGWNGTVVLEAHPDGRINKP